MPTKLAKDDLLKLENLPDAAKSDIAALFADIEERDNQISTLRKKHEDADKIAQRAPELEKAVKDRDAQIQLLNTKLAEYTGKPADEITLSMFAPFFS